MVLEVAEDSLSRSPGAAARWAGVRRESLTRATDLASRQGGGGRDLEMADSFLIGSLHGSLQAMRTAQVVHGIWQEGPCKGSSKDSHPPQSLSP